MSAFRRIGSKTRAAARAMGTLGCAVAMTVVSAARADTPASAASATASDRDGWNVRYRAARRSMIERRYHEAEERFTELARTAGSQSDRELAVEMAHVSAALADAALRGTPPSELGEGDIRTKDELSILYASAFLYGAGTGVWFLLQTQPDSALTATLPFLGITAAPIVALALIDGHRPLPHGVPHAMTAGLYLGLGEGIWLVGYQHARAHRQDASTTDGSRWHADTVVSVLWGGATLGAVTAASLATGLTTTPGRVSYTASTTIWSGVFTGLATAALLPDRPHRAENTMLAAGIGYNAGLLGGALSAGAVSPSVMRVRLVDLAGTAGALVTTGVYLATAHRDADPRIALGVAAGGIATGLAVGWLATAGMGRQLPTSPTSPTISWQPMISPTQGGLTAGIVGTL